MDENSSGWLIQSDLPSPCKPDQATASVAASSTDSEKQLQQEVQLPAAQWNYADPSIVVPPPHNGVYAPPPSRPRFNSLAEAFASKPQGEQQPPTPKQPLQNGNSAANMSNAPPIPGSPLASPQSQLSQGYDGMVPPASPFPPHMQQYAAHSSPVPMSASPGMGMPPPQSPVMSPVPNSVGGGPGMYPQPPTPQQRPTMPQGMPLTPGGGMQMVPPGTPGGCGPMTPHPMTPQSQQQMQQQQQMMQQQQMQQMQQGQQQQMVQQQMQQQQMAQMQQMQASQAQMMQPGMQPGQPQMQQQMVGQPMQAMQQMQPMQQQPGMQPVMQPGQMMGMGPQGQMMMQGQQPYGYPVQPGQQWGQPQMMPPHYVRKPQMMGAAAMPGGAPPQRVMIQRVPYPTGPGYPPGTMAPQQPQQPQQMQQQMPTGPQYAVRPMPPQYPPIPGQPGVPTPPPGYGYPQGTMPAQSPVQYPGGTTVPAGMPMPQGAVPPQYPQQPQQRQQLQQPQQPQPGQQQMQMRPYMQSPQGQQMMAAGQQPVYPQSVPPQQQQQPPGTPQQPFTPNAARYPPGTPTNSSPLHGTPQQQQQLLQQQQQGVVGGPPGTPGTPVQQQQLAPPDMRSPQLMSPSQAQMMQQQQTQPMMHPSARQMSNGDMQMRPVQMQQQVPQQVAVMQPMQQMVPPPHVQPPPYVARDPSHGMVRPDMALVGCHFVVLDWERYTTERSDQMAMKTMVRSLGGDIDFGMKTYESQRPIVTHGIISYLLFPRVGHASPVEHTLHMMIKDGKRIVTMQWLVDVIEGRKMDVPWRIAHMPVPMPLEQMRTNHGRIVSVAGFLDNERGAVKYMVEAIGAKMMPGLTQHTHLLVAKNPSSEKFEKAREWGVPIVNLQWLVDAYLGQARLDLESPRYQVSQQPPIEISCGTFTIEMLHEHYKHCLAAWRVPVPFSDDHWHRALSNKQELDNNEKVFPLKKLKIDSSPAPSEDEISAAHQAEPPTADRRQIIVSFEGFDEELENSMGRKIRMLGGEVTDNIEKCSHLVTVDGKRTIPLLTALALGKNIVGAAWVNSSYDQKQFADTIDFFLRDDESERQHGCNFKLSVLRARKAKVFEDCEFYITPSVDPSPEVVRTLVELAGGVVHPHPPSPAKIIECLETDKPYIMVATECDMPILKYLTDAGCSVFCTEFVFGALMKQEVDVNPMYIVAPNSCAPAPLRLPPMCAAPVSSGASCGPSSAASTPSRRTSTGYAATPPGPVPLTPTQTQVEFASPQTPRIKAN